MKKSMKVLVSLVLIIALLMSYAPSIVLAAPQYPACKQSAIYAVKDVKLVPPFKSDGSANSTSIQVKDEGDHIMHFTLDGGSKQCYCIEPGAGLTIDSTIDSAKANKYWKALKNSSDPKHQKIVTGIYRLVALADYMNPKHDSDIHGIHQIVLWEIICGIRDPLTGVALKTTLQSSFANFETSDQETYYTNRYKQFVIAYQQFDDIPSFMHSSKTTATSKPITLKWNATNKRYQATVTDSKGLLSKMNMTGVFPDYVHVSKSGNNLTLWTTQPITSTLASSRINKNHGFKTSTSPSILVYGGNLEDGDIAQAVVTSSVPDPMAAYLAVKTGTAPTTEVSVNKKWVDDNDRDGVRPDKITVNLLADGKQYKSQVITAADGWKYTFKNLPEYNNSGVKIKYTVSEKTVSKYEVSYSGSNITNTHIFEKTKVSGKKTWVDNNNQDGLRPKSITVHLYADGKKTASKTVTESAGWKYEFTNLPKYRDGGVAIKYEIKEDAVAGYKVSYSGFNITNTHTSDKTKVSGKKTWVDDNNRDGLRPKSITVHLYADGKKTASKTVTESAGWKYEFTDLPKYRDGGVAIKYEIKEDAVSGYKVSYSGLNITNTHTSEKTKVSGKKTWTDDNNQDGLRPKSITVHLYADGKKKASKTVTESAGWKYEFTDLPKYRDGGVAIKYEIKEDAVSGYKVSYSGLNITNTHTSEKTKINCKKTWADNNNQDGIRPKSITVHLYADGKKIDNKTVTEANGWKYEFTNLPKYRDGGIEIKYTIKEDPIEGYETSYDGFDVINTHIPEKTQISGKKTWEDNNNQDGYRPKSITVRLYADGKEIDSKVVTEKDGWKYAFTNLDKYRDHGTKIVYSITEDPVPKYATTYDGLNIINTHGTEKTEIGGVKTWQDKNNQDGVRPDKITVRLYRNGKEYDAKIVTAKEEWKYAWTKLDKYEQGGLLVEWTVKEDPVEGYTPTYDGFNITNHYTPQTVEVSGQKRWDDNGNQDGVRPEQITVRLMRDGEEYDVKTVTAENEWKYAWSGLDKYRDGGEEIVWTVVEDAVPEYVTSYEGYNIVNTHAPAKTEIGGTKTWNDNNNQDGVRPEKITVRLYRDGEEFLAQEVTDVDGVWAYRFTELDVYRDGGVRIEWTISEDAVEGYTTTYDGTNIINTHETATTDVAGFKTWVDDNDRDGLRPDQITVRLYRDGTEYDAKTVTAEDEWKYSWTGLDKYRDGGVEIKWTIDEDAVEGYTKTIDGFNLTNTHEIETITISGRKIWNDGSNAAELRPEAVMLTLCADGEEIDTAEVTMTDAESPDVWEYEFVNLPAYKEGKKISYTIMEKPVANYTAVVQGLDITNSIVPPTDSPKTGDNSRAALPKLMAVMAIAAVVSGGACIALVIRRRKQKRNGQ